MKPVAFALVGLCIWVAGVAAQGAAPRAVQHLAVSASSAAAPARRGQRLPLFVDVTPMPEIHVYAPGAADYQPIALAIDPQPGLSVGTLHYPKSTLLVNEFEKVPVYDKPFRLVQDVTLAPPDHGSRTVTITGKIQYQACDNQVCYKPATIPVSWKIELR